MTYSLFLYPDTCSSCLLQWEVEADQVCQSVLRSPDHIRHRRRTCRVQQESWGDWDKQGLAIESRVIVGIASNLWWSVNAEPENSFTFIQSCKHPIYACIFIIELHFSSAACISGVWTSQTWCFVLIKNILGRTSRWIIRWKNQKIKDFWYPRDPLKVPQLVIRNHCMKD